MMGITFPLTLFVVGVSVLLYIAFIFLKRYVILLPSSLTFIILYQLIGFYSGLKNFWGLFHRLI